MKKLFCLILAIIFIVSFTACNDTNNKDDNEYIESDTNEAVYEKAIKLIDEKKFSDAIELLEEISEYNDSKTLLFKANYIEGCISFNNRDFYKAYECFDAAKEILENNNISKDMASSKEILVYTASNRNESAYHYGVELVNKGNHVSALNYFEKVSKINSNAEKHMEQIISQLLDGNWIGNCTVENVQFQVEVSFDKDAQTLFVHWADRRYGYKSITSAKGSLKIYADKAIFSDGANRTELIFDFYAVNKMRINCNGTREEKALYEGTYEQKSNVAPSYKIAITKYPTYDIPDFYNFSIISNSLSQNDLTNQNNSSNTTVVQQNGSSQKENNNYDNITNAHTHNYSKATCTQPSKCSCGKTSGSALGHKFILATCIQPETCERCGVTKGSANGHNFTYKSPTCWNCDEVNPDLITAKDVEISYENPVTNAKGERIEILSYEITGDWSKNLSLTYKFLDSADTYKFYTDFYDKNGNLIDSMFRWSNGSYEVGYIRTWSNIVVSPDVAKIVIRGN